MCDVEGIHSKRLINAKSMGYHVCGTTQIQLESAAQKKIYEYCSLSFSESLTLLTPLALLFSSHILFFSFFPLQLRVMITHDHFRKQEHWIPGCCLSPLITRKRDGRKNEAYLYQTVLRKFVFFQEWLASDLY